MKEDTKRQLDEAFAQHSRKVEEQRQVKAARQTQEDQFINAFRERCASVIKPALERIGEYLLLKGMTTRVGHTQEQSGRDGRIEASEEIAIRFVISDDERRPYPGIHEQPCFALRADRYKQLIEMYQSTIAPGRGGMSGGIGSVRLEEVTEELLEAKVLALVRDLLK